MVKTQHLTPELLWTISQPIPVTYSESDILMCNKDLRMYECKNQPIIDVIPLIFHRILVQLNKLTLFTYTFSNSIELEKLETVYKFFVSLKTQHYV